METSKFGENVPAVINKWGAKDFYTVSHHIAESGIPDEIVIEIYDVWLEFGDVLPSALIKGGIKNTKHIIELRSKLASNQMLRVLELTEKYGSNVITAIIKCGVKNIDSIVDGITLCDKPETAVRLLNALVNHSDTMLKALEKCDSVTTIKQYLSIAERFGNNFDVMAEKNLFFRDFKGLENAINVDSPALCFTYQFKPNGEIDDSFCVVTRCRINEPNTSISIEYTNADGLTCTQFYSQLLTKDGINKVLDKRGLTGEERKSIYKELEKLVEAIQGARPIAPKSKEYDFSKKSGIPEDFSNEKWVITNCAEIWGAFEMILQGGKFSDLGLVAVFNQGTKKGVYHNPCKNCSRIFYDQFMRIVGMGLIDIGDLSLD